MKITTLVTLAMILFCGLHTPAQEEIEIRSLEVERFVRGSQSSVVFTAVTTQGTEVIYKDGDAPSLPGPFGAERCFPCRGPNLFDTDIFASRETFVFETNGPGQIFQLKFYKVSSSSGPLYLSPRDMVRKSAFSKRGPIVISGRIEVLDPATNEIVAFDNDVVLQGIYSVRFVSPYLFYRPSPFPHEVKMIDQSGKVSYFLSKTDTGR